MRVTATLVLVCVAVAVAGCATPYAKRRWTIAGYSDQRIDKNTFIVSFQANAATSELTVQSYVLLRCAEVTAEAGYDYFVVMGAMDSGRSASIAVPGSSTSQTTGQVSGYGGTAYGSATTTTQTTPGYAFGIRLPGNTVTIKAFNGEKPEDNPMAYDAEEIITYLGRQVKR